MKRRYLFGTVSPAFADDHIARHRLNGDCLVFDYNGQADILLDGADSWESFAGRFPEGGQPDFLVLYLPYRTIPAWLWQAPIPIVGLAGDWNLLWHYYRYCLPQCDLIVTDAMGVDVCRREGLGHAEAGILYGCNNSLLAAKWPEVARDIDVLFVGNFHPAVQSERLPWLGRLARLAERWNVVLKTGVGLEPYRQLLGRARIVFNRGIRGECNLRVFEALAAGALLFQEKENREVPALLLDRQECVLYSDEDLEELLDYYLEHEGERRKIAERARAKLERYSFENLWDDILATIDRQWDKVLVRAQSRVLKSSKDTFLARTWQTYSRTYGDDPALAEDLARGLDEAPRTAALHHALGVLAGMSRSLETAARHFQDAWKSDPRHIVAGANLADVLACLGEKEFAMEQAHRTLAVLDTLTVLPLSCCEAPAFPGDYDLFRVAWEEAAWANAGDRRRESQAKIKLLCWRLHSLIAGLTDDLVHFNSACTYRPDLPQAQGALGCALGRLGRMNDAIGPLQAALAGNPFDRDAARALYHALGTVGRTADQFALARFYRQLRHSASSVIAEEPWFAAPGPPPVLLEKPAVTLKIAWQGSQQAVHSLAYVNRQLCQKLLERGHEVSLLPATTSDPPGRGVVLPASLQTALGRNCAGASDVHVAHQWPPDLSPPKDGHWIIIQPWEYGSIPRAWVRPFTEQVDEIWVPSRFVRNSFVQSGIPEAQVHVVPNGVAEVFFKDTAPYPLKTRKSCRFLFVGGTIERKGIDLLLKAYTETFSDKDDICLVVKDMGVGTFYQGQTAEERIKLLLSQPHAPEVEYIANDLSEEEMASLYAACQCLVHPFRAEGFGLPIAEAMACGLVVIVTGYGPVLDYCDDETTVLLPFRVARFAEAHLGDMPTVTNPWWAVPDQDALRLAMRQIFEEPEKARALGRRARHAMAERFRWDQAVAVIEERLLALRSQPIRRHERRAEPLPSYAPLGERPKVSLCMIVKNEEANLQACLASAQGVADEIIVVDTGSSDATREIARGMGAKVFDFPWIDSFAAARNESLRHARGEWIFWMDADDRLDEANRGKLKHLLAELPAENVGFVMKCLCLPDPETGTATVVDHVRLFRSHPQMRWQYRIHEQILGSMRRLGGSVRWSDVVIQHVGYLNAALRGRKLERDIRLLSLENEENPDDPFTLFNLGSVFHEQGNLAGALQVLKRSLERSHPTDSIVRKLYALIAGCQRHLGQHPEALATCQAGRVHYPDDPEILFQESLIRREQYDRQGAILCLNRLLEVREKEHFASVDAGLQGYKARHNLAHLYQDEGRPEDAEREWRAALAEKPDFLPAWVGLGELYLALSHERELESLVENMQGWPAARMEGELLRARAHLARKEFSAAQKLVDKMIDKFPNALGPRVVLSHILLKQGQIGAAAEQSLRDILAMDPNHEEARSNLAVLIRQRST